MICIKFSHHTIYKNQISLILFCVIFYYFYYIK